MKIYNNILKEFLQKHWAFGLILILSVFMVSTSNAGNYGKGMAEFMKNDDDVLYSQRGIYKESTGYNKNVWKYTKATAAIANVNALDPTTTYLFSEIKRGVDGNYYMPDMGTPADKIHSYSDSAFNTNVNLGEAGNELASSLPTQVYKVFADPAQIPSDNLRAIGKKIYSIKDHQNSQRVSISDEKLVVDVNANNVIDNGDIFTPSVKSYSDFFPMGGMPMPTRTYNANASAFGYQGQLKINEIYGDANVNEFKFRDSDARKGGDFWSPDPLSEKYPQCSPYQFSERRTIDGVELEGLEFSFPRITEYTPVQQKADAEAIKATAIVAKTAAIGFLVVTQPEIGIPWAIADLTGVPVTPSPQAWATTAAVIAEQGTEAAFINSPLVRQNAAKGASFENAVKSDLLATDENVVSQITIKTESGVKTKVDFVSTDKQTGTIKLTEAKSSPYAPLTKNQKTAFPEIKTSGGTVVGKGKAPFTGGTVIPPTSVDIVRPN